MSTLTFHHDELFGGGEPIDSEARHRWETIYNIICDYVQPDSKLSLNEAVERAAEVHKDTRPGNSAINSTLIRLAEQIPYDNPGHLKLAQFFLAYAESDKWLARSRYKDDPKKAWNNFYQHMDENLSDKIVDPENYLEDEEHPLEYPNAQAFRASLMALDFASGSNKLAYLACLMDHAMMDAFDQDLSKERPLVRDTYVMGAAQYPKWAVAEMFALVYSSANPRLNQRLQEKAPKPGHQFLCWQSSRRKRESGKAITLDGAPRGVRVALKQEFPVRSSQWEAWKDGFRAVAGNEMYGSTCRQLAEEAADSMALHEKSCMD